MAAMNTNEKVQLATTVGIGVAVAGVGYLLYRSGLLKGIFNMGGNTLEAVDYTVDAIKDSGKWVWDGWNSTAGLGMYQLGQAANGNFNQMFGSNVQATSAYAVIRARDFDSTWRIKDIAYKAIIGMHSDNKTILEKHVLDGMGLKPALQKLVKVADFVIVFKDGSFKSA